MNYILYDENSRGSLLPFTYTRPVAEIRMGVLTIREKWERLLGLPCSCLTAAYLRDKFPFSPAAENILVNASLLPDAALAKAITSLKPGQALMQQGILLAAWLSESEVRGLADRLNPGSSWELVNPEGPVDPEDLFKPGDLTSSGDLAKLGGLAHLGQLAKLGELANLANLSKLEKLANPGSLSSRGNPDDPGNSINPGNMVNPGNLPSAFLPGQIIEWTASLRRIIHPEDIFNLNAEALIADFDLLTRGRESALPAASNRILGKDLFLEEGVEMECATINTLKGPVYIGKGAVIMEGVNLRGPIAICAGAIVKMGARIYGPTTIGPGSVVGGEIKQSVIFGNTNKSHDGYLGNSVVGEWCNFGADTNCSNMKNNYKSVKLWSYETGTMRDTALSFCGLMMGDFSRTGINTMFNTGTTVGVNVNVYGNAVPPVFVPDFSWGKGDDLQTYLPEKASETAGRIKEQKGAVFTEEEARIHAAVFAQTGQYRKAKEQG